LGVSEYFISVLKPIMCIKTRTLGLHSNTRSQLRCTTFHGFITQCFETFYFYSAYYSEWLTPSWSRNIPQSSRNSITHSFVIEEASYRSLIQRLYAYYKLGGSSPKNSPKLWYFGRIPHPLGPYCLNIIAFSDIRITLACQKRQNLTITLNQH
jgi:hypothetical protein